MGDEDAQVSSALDAFDEGSIDSYARSVRENSAAGSKLNIAKIKAIATRTGVPWWDGERGRYTRPMVIRDLMEASIQISEDAEPSSRSPNSSSASHVWQRRVLGASTDAG